MTQEAELRATSDVLLAAIDELRTVEEEKREVSPDDPSFSELAARVDHLARTVLDLSQVQREHADARVRPSRPISEVPADLPMAAILERWRAAERQLESTTQGSEEWLTAAAEADACREAYRRAWEMRASGG